MRRGSGGLMRRGAERDVWDGGRGSEARGVGANLVGDVHIPPIFIAASLSEAGETVICETG